MHTVGPSNPEIPNGGCEVQGNRGQALYVLKKHPHVSGPMQFKSMLFKGQPDLMCT